jgi:hypothetical protein
MRPRRTVGRAPEEDVSLATALGFLGVLIYKVWSIPLWIVILAGAVMMVASLAETLRGEERG